MEEEYNVESRMDDCAHYTIRGDIAKYRERDPRVNYPFTLSQELRQDQERIKSLLPTMDSRKCNRWNCLLCLKEYFEQECPHGEQRTAEASSSITASAHLDDGLVTRTNNSTVTKINSVEVLICTDSKNAEVESTMKNGQNEPKVFFDLNEAPIAQPWNKALKDSNNALAPEEPVAADNAERWIVPVDEQQTINLEDAEPELSSPNNDNVSYLSGEGEREGSQNVPRNYCPQPKKTETNNKKKMLLNGNQEREISAMISKVAEVSSGKIIENRTFDLNLSLEQNYMMPGVSLSPQPTPNGKRKNQENCDLNGNSDAIVPSSSEKGLQNKANRILQLKKRRIFCTSAKTPILDADKSQRVELDGDKVQGLEPDADPSISKRKESLSSPVCDLANSRPKRIKKATSKAAYQLMLRRNRKNKNHGKSTGIAASDKKALDESSTIIVEKELVLQHEPIAKFVPMPCLETDNFNLRQLKSEIKSMLLSRGVKRLKVDSTSANKKQIDLPISDLGTSPNQSKNSEGKGEDNLTLGAPQQKKGINKSSGKEIKKRGRPRKVRTSCSGSKVKGGREQTAPTVGNELVLREETIESTISPNEEALHMLSIVASQALDFDALSDTRLDHIILPIVEEFHDPPIRDVMKMGYGVCIELLNPAEHFLVDGEGDRYKLGPEDLPLRPHRLLPAKNAAPVMVVSHTVAATRLPVLAD